VATRNVLITGTSRGLGRAVAERLAATGWTVWAGVRDETRPAPAGAAASVVLDVRDPAGIERALGEVLERCGGRLDAVVVNAGIFAIGAFEDTPPELTRAILETNFIGAVETVRLALPAVRAARGRIVVMSSDSGLCGTPGLAAYTASKYALEGWAESLAYELEPLGVFVALIEPGAFRTGIWSSGVERRPGSPYAGLADLLERHMRTGGASAQDPAEVAAVVAAALEAEQPRLRYPVGRDARRAALLKRLLPDRAFMALTRRTTGIARWRPPPG
jgi:NAD(P)-dependent dehydrogenase (short-subunit alcohol dehydrogenase family)